MRGWQTRSPNVGDSSVPANALGNVWPNCSRHLDGEYGENKLIHVRSTHLLPPMSEGTHSAVPDVLAHMEIFCFCVHAFATW